MVRIAKHYWNGRIVPLAYCVDVAVHPEFQGQGLATTLSQKAFDYAAPHGARGIFLYTDKQTNPKAYGLYQKLGFQEIGPVEMLVLGPSGPVPGTDLLVRAAKDSEGSWIRSLLEKNYHHFTFYSPDSPLQFSTPSPDLTPGNATFIVEKSRQIQGAFSIFHYGEIWQYQTPLGFVTPLLLHNAARTPELSEAEFWSAIVSHLRLWQASYPMIGQFVDAAENQRLATLKQLGFQKLQGGQWYFRTLDSSGPPPAPPVYTGFPL